MKICLYFAVNGYQNYLYLTERKLHTFNFNNNASRLFDLICDQNALEHELNWNKIDEIHKPTAIGTYQAVVEYVQTADDDYRLDVITCTPICLI